MKIIEINNRKDTYVYDEEYCEFFNDDGGLGTSRSQRYKSGI